MDRADDKALRNQKKKLSPEDRRLALRLASEQPTISGDEDPLSELRMTTMSILGRLRASFQGRIIRRSPHSVDNEGNSVSKELPMYKVVTVWVKLSNDESNAITAKADQITKA
jgi:hypothetical protein